MPSYFGKYRGKVKNNIDPMMLGRVQVNVPAVLGDTSLSWAMPSVPYAGNGVGFFMIPPTDANVWVEFEGGDIDYPIWSGCFWGTGEVPATPAVPQMKVIKMDTIALTLSELPGAGGVTLEVSPPSVALPLKMTFDAQGIKLDAGPLGTIELTPSGVKINGGALEVT
ncbi:MAG: baseplate assembly protein [Anaerolineae bacterium]|nr:baseplate assembly protein [Anaerolineae bacterium]